MLLTSYMARGPVREDLYFFKRKSALFLLTCPQSISSTWTLQIYRNMPSPSSNTRILLQWMQIILVLLMKNTWLRANPAPSQSTSAYFVLVSASTYSHLFSRRNECILSYLLSHVCAISLLSVKIALLQTVGKISNGVKAQTLLPAIQNLVQNSLGTAVSGASLEKYAALIISSFDVSSSDELNDQNSSLWPVFVSLLRYVFQSGVQVVPRWLVIGDTNYYV